MNVFHLQYGKYLPNRSVHTQYANDFYITNKDVSASVTLANAKCSVVYIMYVYVLESCEEYFNKLKYALRNTINKIQQKVAIK